jgi:hypothetical protein
MNDKPETESAAQPDLAAAVRQARVENAERGEAIADLREIEMGRLALLESALKPVVAQAPPDVDMFDLALAPGDHPRLFVDMIAFVDMAHDRRTYRFHQDTRNGRVLIAESQSVDAIAAAVANYVARRLVERERALASDWREAQAPQADYKAPQANNKPPQAHQKAPQTEAKGQRAWPIAGGPARVLSPPAGGASEAIEAAADDWAAPPRRRFVQRLGDALRLFLMLLGSITLALLIGLGGYLAWTMRLRDLWAQWMAPPPF